MKKHRAFLKWAGGKYSLVEEIQRHLPEARKLVEPFVGAGSVFLNSDYDNYLLADINPDLINLYNHLKNNPDQFIEDAFEFFQPKYNHKEAYLSLRFEFNQCLDTYRRSLLFLYMNRHGFNGLCRYNRQGGFNVPFGSYKAPYFPEKEMIYFAEKAKKATFICKNYRQTFFRARKGCVIYCDPPYAPLSTTANFTSYAVNSFSLDDQAKLAELAEKSALNRNIPVLLSNHDTALTRRLYQGAKLSSIQVKRTISRNVSNRNKVNELMALFHQSFD